MADILIRGMEMPLFKTELIVFPSGVVQVYDSRENYLGKAQAVPLPEGHGDLIERKRLDLVPDYKSVRNGIKRIVKETKRDGRAIAGIPIELLEQTIVVLDELRSVRRYFANAETIIEAEGGGEE